VQNGKKTDVDIDGRNDRGDVNSRLAREQEKKLFKLFCSQNIGPSILFHFMQKCHKMAST